MKLGRGKRRGKPGWPVVPLGGRVDRSRQIGCVPPRYRTGQSWRGLVKAKRFRLQPRRRACRSEDGRDVRDQALARLEAVLFLAKEPLNTRKLGQYANLADGTQARTLVDRLNQLYDRAGRAFRVQELAGGLQLLTRPQFSSWLRRLEHIPAETRLSAPAMETLAVVAYRQPVVRTEIEAVRGVGCGEILRQLLDRDLIRVAGRSDDLGRPYMYGTTKRFLQLFGLRSVDELPRADVFRSGDANVSEGAKQAQAPHGCSNKHDSTVNSGQQEERDSQVSVTSQFDTRCLKEADSVTVRPEHVEPSPALAEWKELVLAKDKDEDEDDDYDDEEWEEEEEEDEEEEDDEDFEEDDEGEEDLDDEDLDEDLDDDDEEWEEVTDDDFEEEEEEEDEEEEEEEDELEDDYDLDEYDEEEDWEED